MTHFICLWTYQVKCNYWCFMRGIQAHESEKLAPIRTPTRASLKLLFQHLLSFTGPVRRQKTTVVEVQSLRNSWWKFELKTEVPGGTYNEDPEEAGNSSWSSSPGLKEALEDSEMCADLYSGTQSHIYNNHRRSWLIVWDGCSLSISHKAHLLLQSSTAAPGGVLLLPLQHWRGI